PDRRANAPKHVLLHHLAFHYIVAPVHALHAFFFTHPAPTEIYTLSLHDALPISCRARTDRGCRRRLRRSRTRDRAPRNDSRSSRDRKSTRLNSSHRTISYAVFCLKKKKT